MVGFDVVHAKEIITNKLFFGDGDTGFYESVADTLRVNIGGTSRAVFTGSTFTIEGLAAGRGTMQIGAGTSTHPPFTFNGDLDTGLGSAGADNVSLIAGGLEGARIEDPADCSATETSLWLYDKDNDTIQQVTVGADDSGGAGFKVLRITN